MIGNRFCQDTLSHQPEWPHKSTEARSGNLEKCLLLIASRPASSNSGELYAAYSTVIIQIDLFQPFTIKVRFGDNMEVFSPKTSLDLRLPGSDWSHARWHSQATSFSTPGLLGFVSIPLRITNCARWSCTSLRHEPKADQSTKYI